MFNFKHDLECNNQRADAGKDGCSCLGRMARQLATANELKSVAEKYVINKDDIIGLLRNIVTEKEAEITRLNAALDLAREYVKCRDNWRYSMDNKEIRQKTEETLKAIDNARGK